MCANWVNHNAEHWEHELRVCKRLEGGYPLGICMQAEVELHNPNMYTFVHVCCGAEQKLYKNVPGNHAKPSSQISQMHPLNAPCWRTPPNYRTDAGVFQVNVRGAYGDY
ncbi:hypothetical protein O181_025189 [Austropuccinia psidii MF-1]|uniref:Uncharacterized protein n=1 Tax=Austropuccinia psidii MF-1 TaxID=1389203 RepID=A0A9Q3CHK5_9BASI|nr:hypothetical protein [Austropuccinia psidii MF-1]